MEKYWNLPGPKPHYHHVSKSETTPQIMTKNVHTWCIVMPKGVQNWPRLLCNTWCILVPKRLQSRRGKFIHKNFVTMHDQTALQQNWLPGCSCDQSCASVRSTCIAQHMQNMLNGNI